MGSKIGRIPVKNGFRLIPGKDVYCPRCREYRGCLKVEYKENVAPKSYPGAVNQSEQDYIQWLNRQKQLGNK